MFSSRIAWHAPMNRLSRLLVERRARGAALLDLTESNPTRVGLDHPWREIAAALGDPGVASYEPEPRGSPAARRAVSERCARRGIPVPPERIVLTASSSEAYSFLFKLLADPGETVLVPRPSYPLFDYLAALESVRLASYPIAEDGGWSIDLAAVERALTTEPARALVVVNPNNPTGSALRARERLALEAICAPRGIAIISDEVFFDFLHAPPADRSGERIVSLSSPREAGEPGALSFTLGGLSKSCGLPQMKLGWILVGGPDDQAAGALERLDLIADTYLSVGTPVQRAAPRLLDLGERIQALIRQRVLENRTCLAGSLGTGSPCRLLPSDGGWSAVLQVPAILPEEELVVKLLQEDDVLVHPGYFFDFPREAYLILSLLPEVATFQEGVRRILARVTR
jgi:alanine-synthesizing transaminase